jgi:hypothetical protein
VDLRYYEDTSTGMIENRQMSKSAELRQWGFARTQGLGADGAGRAEGVLGPMR